MIAYWGSISLPQFASDKAGLNTSYMDHTCNKAFIA
jgi:hypothetical protein